jgi:hypothetical protein
MTRQSKWSQYDEQIKAAYSDGNTKTYHIAKLILGAEADKYDLDVFRTYIKRNFSTTPNDLGNVTTTETKQYNYAAVLSARKEDGGIMSAKEFCQHYGLPYEEAKSYKLLTHTKYPTYNIASHNVNEDEREQITPELIEAIVKKHIRPIYFAQPKSIKECNFVDRVVFTDTHIGMEVSSATSQYDGDWKPATILNRFKQMMQMLSKYKRGSELYLIDLGDYMDGYDGFTARKEHKLPQCMDTQEAFDLGVECKLLILDAAIQMYDHVTLDNVCNDNHGGSFAYLVNSAVEKIALHRYGKNVQVRNHRKFINHYIIKNRAFVFSHGKDEKFMKRGMKASPDLTDIQKVDAYCKSNGLYAYPEITFEKGDSHQAILDFSTSDDFAYLSYLSFAPQSEWVQTNFKQGKSGFVIQNINFEDKAISFTPVFFKP